MVIVKSSCAPRKPKKNGRPKRAESRGGLTDTTRSYLPRKNKSCDVDWARAKIEVEELSRRIGLHLLAGRPEVAVRILADYVSPRVDPIPVWAVELNGGRCPQCRGEGGEHYDWCPRVKR